MASAGTISRESDQMMKVNVRFFFEDKERPLIEFKADKTFKVGDPVIIHNDNEYEVLHIEEEFIITKGIANLNVYVGYSSARHTRRTPLLLRRLGRYWRMRPNWHRGNKISY